MGRSGKFLREMLKSIGLSDQEIFITSPAHYLPVKGTPSKESVLHGRIHLLKQLSVVDPEIVVLLGNTARTALFDQVSIKCGTVMHHDNRSYLFTVHPAYAMRFPKGREQFIADLQHLKKLLRSKDCMREYK